MTRQLTPKLPNELFELILEILNDNDDSLSLSAFSLACRRLSMRSRRLLFRRIKLKVFFRSGKPFIHYFQPIPEDFIFLLRQSPHLVKYVQTFELELQNPELYPGKNVHFVPKLNWNYYDFKLLPPSYIAKPPEKTSPTPNPPNEEDIPLIRGLFAGLTTFSLTAITNPDSDDFSRWCPGIIKTLSQALAITKSLEVLDVTAIYDFPLASLRGCTTLRSLGIWGFPTDEEFDTSEEPTNLTSSLSQPGNSAPTTNKVSQCTPSLLHLPARASGYFIQFLTNPHGVLNVAGITELSLEYDKGSSRSHERECEIMQLKWPHITSLHLRAADYRFLIRLQQIPQHPLLANYEALRTITFHLPIPEAVHLDELLLLVVHLLRGVISSRETLSKVVLELDFTDFIESTDTMLLSSIDWSRLGALRSHFLNFKKFVIRPRRLQSDKILDNESLRVLLQDDFVDFDT